MRAFFALPSLISLVLAQSGTDTAAPAVPTESVPSCALTCTFSSLSGTGCEQYGVSNLTCICTDTDFQAAYYMCQLQSCSEAELNAAQQYGAQICEGNGTPINISATPSAASSSMPTTSVSASDMMSSGMSSASSDMSSMTSAASESATSAASDAGGENGAQGFSRGSLAGALVAGLALAVGGVATLV